MEAEIRRLVEEARETGRLDLSFTGLQDLPDEIGSLTALTSLNVSGTGCRCCRIRSAPHRPDDTGRVREGVVGAAEWVGNLTALTTLNVSGKELSVLPDGSAPSPPWNSEPVREWAVGPAGVRSATSPPWSSGRVREWVVGAAEFGRQPHRPDDLDVSGKGLLALPDAAGNLTALTTLNLSGNGAVGAAGVRSATSPP